MPSDDPGQPVIKAEGGQAVADADDPGQVINDDDDGIYGNLRADGPVRAEIQTAVKQVTQPEGSDVGHGDTHQQRPAQPAVQGGQQSEVDREGEAVDDHEPEQARGHDLGQAEREPAHDCGHGSGEPLPTGVPILGAHRSRPRHVRQPCTPE
jgi:hypothetical protein